MFKIKGKFIESEMEFGENKFIKNMLIIYANKCKNVFQLKLTLTQ